MKAWGKKRTPPPLKEVSGNVLERPTDDNVSKKH